MSLEFIVTSAVRKRANAAGKMVTEEFLFALDNLVRSKLDGACRLHNGGHKRLDASLLVHASARPPEPQPECAGRLAAGFIQGVPSFLCLMLLSCLMLSGCGLAAGKLDPGCQYLFYAGSLTHKGNCTNVIHAYAPARQP